MDPAPADALIKTDDPEMTDALLEFGRRMLREHGIVDSGDTTALGIGAMTAARWSSFFSTMQKQGLYQPDLDPALAYTAAVRRQGHGSVDASKIDAARH